MNLKEVARTVLNFLHLDLTKNLEYDRLTKSIMKNSIQKDWNCIDIGCHKGEILDVILKYAPNGNHWAFEPIPDYFQQLQKKYSSKVKIMDVALSDQKGQSQFNFVKNAPAYSGINKRQYQVENPDIVKLNVELNRLDDIIPVNQKIDFIKIDVEGAEYAVIKGGIECIKRCKPMIIFEFGLGASDYYGTKPGDMFDLLENEVGLKIYTLKNGLSQSKPFSRDEFVRCYNQKEEYYFIAK